MYIINKLVINDRIKIKDVTNDKFSKKLVKLKKSVIINE